METHQGLAGKIKTPEKILILRGGAVGDLLLTLPSIWCIRRHYPRATIHLLCRSSFHEWVMRLGLVDECRSIDGRLMSQLYVAGMTLSPADSEFMASFTMIVNYLHDPDGIIAGNFRRYSEAMLVGISPLPSHVHYDDLMFEPLARMGVRDLRPSLRSQVRQLFRESTRRNDPSYAVIHPGSGSRYKNWPLENFIGLSQRLHDELGMKLCWMLGEAELDLVDCIKDRTSGDEWVLMAPLHELADILVHARAYIGNDSGISHLADLCGSSGVVLFGPSDPTVWGPRGGSLIALCDADRTGSSLETLSIERVVAVLKERL